MIEFLGSWPRQETRISLILLPFRFSGSSDKTTNMPCSLRAQTISVPTQVFSCGRVATTAIAGGSKETVFHLGPDEILIICPARLESSPTDGAYGAPLTKFHSSPSIVTHRKTFHFDSICQFFGVVDEVSFDFCENEKLPVSRLKRTISHGRLSSSVSCESSERCIFSGQCCENENTRTREAETICVFTILP